MSGLDDQARRALATLQLAAPWVPAREGVDHDVVIVGAGQNGTALSFALRRLGIVRHSVIERAEPARTGGWRLPARMNLLRTPKAVSGPELGVSELGFRHWYERRHGAAAYDAIEFIRRLDWADYLDWFREITQPPVRHETELLQVEPMGKYLRLHLRSQGCERVETTRKLVLCNGIAGWGGANIPEGIASALPSAVFSHTGQDLNAAQLRGRRVAVLGAAASAFDAAAFAAESGAAQVHLFSRRRALTDGSPAQLRSHPGATRSFSQLPDGLRWRFALQARRYGSAPPQEALRRVASLANFHQHFSAVWKGLHLHDGRVRFTSQGEPFDFDHLILGTGYRADALHVPELVSMAPQIARWSDRYEPALPERDEMLGMAPYLSPGYALQARKPGQAPCLANIHLYSAAASTSFGRPIGDVPSMLEGLSALADTLVRDLYSDDFGVHLRNAGITPSAPVDALIEERAQRPASRDKETS